MPFDRTLTLRQLVPFLFLPAGIGLLFKIAIAPLAAQRILALALALFCLELARMAWIDLRNIEALAAANSPTAAAKAVEPQTTRLQVEPSKTTQQLNRFHKVVVSTIALEATGFYLTLISLPVGATAIVLSQIWFNLLAKIQLHPTQPISIVSFGIQERQAILAVNALTAGLLCLWPIQPMRLGLATAFLVLVTLYLTIKYGSEVRSKKKKSV